VDPPGQPAGMGVRGKGLGGLAALEPPALVAGLDDLTSATCQHHDRSGGPAEAIDLISVALHRRPRGHSSLAAPGIVKRRIGFALDCAGTSPLFNRHDTYRLRWIVALAAISMSRREFDP